MRWTLVLVPSLHRMRLLPLMQSIKLEFQPKPKSIFTLHCLPLLNKIWNSIQGLPINLPKMIMKMAPILFIAFGRLVAVFITGYPVDNIEYGFHWNFFFSLFVAKLFGKFIEVPCFCGIKWKLRSNLDTFSTKSAASCYWLGYCCYIWNQTYEHRFYWIFDGLCSPKGRLFSDS